MRERLALAVECYDAGDTTSELNTITSWVQRVREGFDLIPTHAAVNFAGQTPPVPASILCFRVAMFAGISLLAWGRTMSGTRTRPMPWPMKSTAILTRALDSVTGSTVTSTVARTGPSIPRTPQDRGGSTWVSTDVTVRSAPPIRRVVRHFAPTRGTPRPRRQRLRGPPDGRRSLPVATHGNGLDR
jgi:hypothetical protein